MLCRAVISLLPALAAFGAHGSSLSLTSRDDGCKMLLACQPVTALLVRLLSLLESGKLQLQEADAMRLLAACTVPLVLRVRLLPWVAPLFPPGLTLAPRRGAREDVGCLRHGCAGNV